MQVSLLSLKSGQAGTVAEVKALNGAAKRLADLGFVKGAALEMVRPGKPCIVRIGGSRVGLGVGHQECISLEVL